MFFLPFECDRGILNLLWHCHCTEKQTCNIQIKKSSWICKLYYMYNSA